MVQVNNLITRAQELKSLGAALAERDTIITPAASQGATETVTTYTYTGYDEEGNEISLTEDQYNALVSAAGSNSNSNVTYNVIPTEVVNSGASWWINSEGQYEWVPVTESDKAHLAEINAYRTSTGLAARTTLISGASKSAEYSERWYSTGGGNRGVGASKVKVVSSSGKVVKSYDYDTVDRAPTGSGDVKLSQLKSSSSINNSSSAKSNTAQTAKAAVLSYQQAAEKYHSGEVQLADGSWIKQHEVIGNEEDTGIRIFESAAEGNAVRAAEKEAAAQGKAKAEAAAAAYIPILGIGGNAIEAIEVKRHSLESTAGIQGIISGDGYLSRASAVAKYDLQKQAEKEASKWISNFLSGSPSWLTEAASMDYTEWRSSLNLETLDLQPASIKGVTAAGITGLNSIGIGNYSDVAQAIAEAKESGKTTSTADNSLVQAAENIIETVSEKHSDLKEKAADKLSFLPTADELENSIQETLNKTTVDENLYSLTLIGQIDTAYDKIEKSLANNSDILSTAIKGSIDLQQNAGKAILEGTKGFLKDEYDYAREDPLGYAEETAAIAATGYVFGAGLKLGTMATRRGLTKIGAETAAMYVEPVTHGVLGGTFAITEGGSVLEVYQSEGGAAAVTEALEIGKEFSIGAIGYKYGMKHADVGISLYDARFNGKVATEDVLNSDVIGHLETGGKSGDQLPFTKQGQTVSDVIEGYKVSDVKLKVEDSVHVTLKDIVKNTKGVRGQYTLAETSEILSIGQKAKVQKFVGWHATPSAFKVSKEGTLGGRGALDEFNNVLKARPGDNAAEIYISSEESGLSAHFLKVNVEYESPISAAKSALTGGKGLIQTTAGQVITTSGKLIETRGNMLKADAEMFGGKSPESAVKIGETLSQKGKSLTEAGLTNIRESPAASYLGGKVLQVSGKAQEIIGAPAAIVGKAANWEAMRQVGENTYSEGKLLSEAGKALSKKGLEKMSSPLKPSAMRVEVTGGVKELPAEVKGDVDLADRFLTGLLPNKPTLGEAYTTTKLERNVLTGRAEVEAAVVPGTKFEIVAEDKYFVLPGKKTVIRIPGTNKELTLPTIDRRIPIREVRTIRGVESKAEAQAAERVLSETEFLKLSNGEYGTKTKESYKVLSRNVLGEPFYSSYDSELYPLPVEVYRPTTERYTPVRRYTPPGNYDMYTPPVRGAYPPGRRSGSRGDNYTLNYGRGTYRRDTYPPDYRPPNYGSDRYQDDDIIPDLPKYGRSGNSDIIASDARWKSKVKKHYLLDPQTFVMGRKKRRL